MASRICAGPPPPIVRLTKKIVPPVAEPNAWMSQRAGRAGSSIVVSAPLPLTFSSTFQKSPSADVYSGVPVTVSIVSRPVPAGRVGGQPEQRDRVGARALDAHARRPLQRRDSFDRALGAALLRPPAHDLGLVVDRDLDTLATVEDGHRRARLLPPQVGSTSSNG